MKEILRLEGGLGNQLFQYANARALQQAWGTETMYLDLHAYNAKQIRSLSIHHFHIPENIRPLPNTLATKIMLGYFRFLNRIASVIQNHNRASIATYHFLCKLGLYQQYQVRAFDNKVKPLTPCIYLSGNWISPKFFQGIEDLLRKELIVKTPLNEASLRIKRQILQCNSVCIHIRLGDYLDPQWKDKLYICTEEYYQKGIDYITAKVENPIFFVFSNRHQDIEWIKKNYKFSDKTVYVDLSNPDYEDMVLMYSCKHFIMSNSTYSWWAQFLGASPEKIVVAPSRFNNYPKWDMTDIYQDHWHIINV